MKYFSMFSGIAGFEKGIQNARNDWQCVGYSEIDRYGCAIYRYHYAEHRNFGDATRIVPEELPEFDCIVGGFPCQSFSIAGKRGGFSDTRGTLFFDIARIARVKRPRYLFLENVKGLLSHDEGNTFATIISTLDELGYDCQWQVLNSKNHGVPQNRERVFIIGHLRGTDRPQILPISESSEARDGSEQGDITGTMKPGWGNKQNDSTYIVQAIDANYAKGNAGFAGSSRAAVIEPLIIHENKSGTQTAHEEAQALRSGASHNYQTVGRVRRLTPTECERLQGFPDDWTKYGTFKDGVIKPISDSQRYKCLGNAVTTNVIRDIVARF